MRNSIFIIIDAMRNYKSKSDERGRQDVLDILPEKGFSLFDGIAVTAPSSLMSAVTMLTGKPAYAQFPSYGETNFKYYKINTLTNKLNSEGYNSTGLFSAREMREKLKCQYSYLKNKYLISKNAYLSERWSNKFICNQVQALVKTDFFNNPFHLMLWFNSREDTRTSYYVEETINSLINLPEWEDTFVIVSGDHGYPDLRRGFSSDGPDLKKVGLRHDLIMTDDNIIVPLACKYGIQKIDNIIAKGIYKQEIIYDLANSYHKGLSMVQLEKYIERNHLKKLNFYIGDSRFFLQEQRATTVRSNDKKLIIRNEKYLEAYDLENDFLEEKPLIFNSKKIPIEYKNLYKFYNENEKVNFDKWTKIYRNIIEFKIFKNKIFKKIIRSSKKLELLVIGSNTFEKVIIEAFSKQKLFNNYNSDKLKIIVLDDIRINKNINQVRKFYKNGDIILDNQLNIIGSKIQLNFQYWIVKIESTIRRTMWRVSMQNSLNGKLKEIVLTIFTLITTNLKFR